MAQNSRRIDVGELTRVLLEDLRTPGLGVNGLAGRIRDLVSELSAEGEKAEDARNDLVRRRTEDLQAVAVKRRQRVEAFARRRRQVVADQEGLFIVAGRVTDTGTGVGLPNVRVRAFDRDRRRDDPLGNSGTDALGYFRIEFKTADFRDLVEKRPDVFVEVLDADREVIARSPYRPIPASQSNVFIAVAVDGHKVPANLSVGNKIDGFVTRRLNHLERQKRVLRPVILRAVPRVVVSEPAPAVGPAPAGEPQTGDSGPEPGPEPPAAAGSPDEPPTDAGSPDEPADAAGPETRDDFTLIGMLQPKGRGNLNDAEPAYAARIFTFREFASADSTAVLRQAYAQVLTHLSDRGRRLVRRWQGFAGQLADAGLHVAADVVDLGGDRLREVFPNLNAARIRRFLDLATQRAENAGGS